MMTTKPPKIFRTTCVSSPVARRAAPAVAREPATMAGMAVFLSMRWFFRWDRRAVKDVGRK